MARKAPAQQQFLSGSPQPTFVDYSLAPIVSTRSPTSADLGYKLGQQWVDTANTTVYFLADVSAGAATWSAANGGNSDVNTINSLTPTGGNIVIAGTASEITVSNAGSTITLSTPAAFIAPGSIESTTSMTVGNHLVVTAGGADITGGLTLDTLTITGDVTLGSNAGDTITIGNTSGATAIIENVGTGNYVLDGAATSTYTVGASTTSGTITIGGTAMTGDLTIGSSSGSGALLLANGSGACDVHIADVQTGGSVAIGSSMTSGTVSIGGTGAQTGTVTLSASTGAQTIAIGNANGAKTINMGGGVSGNTISIGNGANTSAQIINIAAGATAANSTVNVLSGNGSAGTQTLNILTGTRAGALNLATGAAAHVIAVGSASAGAVTVDTAAGISLDAATASNFTITGAADLTLQSTAGSVVMTGGEAAVDAITITASDAAGGIDMNCGTGGMTLDTTAGFSLDAATASNVTVTGASQDLTLRAAGGSVAISATEAASDAITITASDAAGGIQLSAGTGNTTITSGDLIVAHSSAGADVTGEVTNSDNTNGASRAGVEIATGGASSGDPYLSFQISGVGASTMTMGLDNSASDLFVISNSTAIGTSNALTLTQAGALNATTSITAGTSITATAGDITATNGNIVLGGVATQFQMNGGAATDFIGEATLTLGTVDVLNTNIDATDRIFLTRRAINGSTALGMLTYAITGSTKFTITAVQTATPAATETNDTSIIDYVIIRQN